jgi:hypothetical protein
MMEEAKLVEPIQKEGKIKYFEKFSEEVIAYLDKPIAEQLGAVNTLSLKFNLTNSEGSKIFNELKKTREKEEKELEKNKIEEEKLKQKREKELERQKRIEEREQEKIRKKEQKKLNELEKRAKIEQEESERVLEKQNKKVKISQEEPIDILKLEKTEQEIEKCVEGKINWLAEDYWNSWDKVKGHCKKLWGSKNEYLGQKIKWFLLAHNHDIIKGKPQLIETVQKRIPLVRMALKIEENSEGVEKEVQSFYFFDEKFDKRHDGFQQEAFALDFWTYKIITDEGKDYFVLTEQKLPNETCTLKGMIVEMDDSAELSRTMSLKSLSRIFFMKEFEPSVKILTKEQLVAYTKEREINEQDWLNFLAYHQIGTYNFFTEEFQKLKSAFILAGKKDGSPLHLGVMGGAGLRKSMGIIETTAYKFSEEPKVLEGGNSRIKALTPSFKEKPANIGYLAQQERIGWVDEIGKMVEFELNKHQVTQGNVMGEINFLLDNKIRMVGSGNDNSCEVQATGKYMFVTNPINQKSTIYQHVGVIDPTTMSRILWFILDKDEQEFVLSTKGIVKIPPTPTQDPSEEGQNPPTPTQAHPLTNYKGELNKIEKNTLGLKKCWGKVSSREEFLTLFDSCYSFVSEVDENEVEKKANGITMIAKEPMKNSVWRPRAQHHIFLLIDGLCKHRCLFKDYDSSFTAKQEDYDLAEKILVRMVNSWDTNLSPKEEFRR